MLDAVGDSLALLRWSFDLVMELSELKLETLRQDGEFILYRGRHRRQTDATPPPILVLTPAIEHPAPGCLRRMEHEFSLKAELESPRPGPETAKTTATAPTTTEAGIVALKVPLTIPQWRSSEIGK